DCLFLQCNKHKYPDHDSIDVDTRYVQQILLIQCFVLQLVHGLIEPKLKLKLILVIKLMLP
ncbi:hypothetical protein HMPREF0506_1280, partial [Lactobacillus crispatus JV-V01]